MTCRQAVRTNRTARIGRSLARAARIKIANKKVPEPFEFERREFECRACCAQRIRTDGLVLFESEKIGGMSRTVKIQPSVDGVY